MELIDYNRFVWRVDKNVPGRHIREAGGGEAVEDIWKLTKHGEQNLFIGTYATSTVPLSPEALFAHVRNAWLSLRWELPTIAAKTAHDWHGAGKPPTIYIVYDEVKSDEDIEQWLEETTEIFPTYGAENKTLDDLRYDVGQEPIPVNDYDWQTFLYLVPYSSTKFGLLLRTAHTTFDGAGVKILMTRLFKHLAAYIGDPVEYASSQKEKLRWGTGDEANALPLFITEILREEEAEVKDDRDNVLSEAKRAEPRDGPEYWATLGQVMEELVGGMPRQHPFKSFIEPRFDPTTSKPKTRRYEHRFTVEQSQAIHRAGLQHGLGSSPSNPNQKLTVNHLVHGALSLLPIYDNPLPADTDALVYYFGLVDARQRLGKDYRTSPLDYPGYCLGVSSLHIPAKLFHQYDAEKQKKELVFAFAKEVRREYVKQAAFPALLAIEPQQGELMMGGPAPPPWVGPAYAADGKGAVYLYPVYKAGKDEKTIIEIDDFFLGLNKCDPGPFFRCYEWKGRIILSVDYNEFAVSEETIKQWMGLWVDLLLSVTV
ncbi:hypothetical protein D9613_003717 [Agrocybe pediades]|uniref:Uncharacterized protein n=1 Tax=Agrocybe pediades TaxID=84607 RepID=A0A8H4QK19_9AGAR|nr:hypothetical protein D9613_003717 [Agrocybe pediades]